MRPTDTRIWLDERGEAFVAPATATTCSGRSDGQTHYLFAPFDPYMLQPLTLCGIRAGDIPGDDEVTCWECREAREA